ncbi:AAA family ATPase, partial [Streptomyces sp. SID11233]|nr:AAA family ATPase [Streptomyces sp. SID11233]
MPHGHPGPQEPIARPGPHAAELGLLLEELRLARAGSRLVTLSGEPWIGKSRLARLLSWEAEHRGWVVAWGRPPWDGAPRPFHSLVDALDDWLAAADPAALRRLGEVRIRTLARLFPALGGAGTDGGGGVDVHATARAVRALLELMAGDDGLLLVLDDAHRAGPEMIELAEYLMHHPPAAPVLTVLVHRRGPTALALSGLTAGVGAVRPVELRPLDRAHAESLLPPGIGPLRRELVLRDAEGVPGLLRALAAAESPEPEQPAHSTRELACGAPPWRAGVPGLDLRTLSPLGRRTMATAAVMGDPFSVTALAAGPDTGEALRAVEELHGEGIVRPDTRAGWFRFARPVVRALMWHAYGPERGVGPVPAGGDRPEAVTALLETSSTPTSREAALLEESARAMVFEQPARSARSARRVAQSPDAPVSARLLLCQALVLSGRLPEAVGEYARLWPLQERFGGPAGPWAEAAVWRARALRLLGAGAQAR